MPQGIKQKFSHFTAVHQMFTQAAFALLHLASSLLSFKSLLLVQLLSLCMMHRPL